MTGHSKIRTNDLDLRPERSLGIEYPIMHLASAVCKNAVQDFWSLDWHQSLAAFLWLIEEAPYWLKALDIIEDPNDPDLILWRLANEGEEIQTVRRRV